MEVSESQTDPDGHELIETVASLTGLPEPWVLKELDHILEQSGQNPGELTLDQLRESLVLYLESIQADLFSGEPPIAD